MALTRRSLKLTVSYGLDWLVVILIAVVGGLFTLIPGNHRAFSLADPDISYPYLAHETVSTTTLVLVAVLAPAVITLAICLLFTPGSTASKDVPSGLIWRRKLWEWNTAWLGLGLSCALAFFITDALKILFGQPRPDMLARCDPDLSAISQYVVGGLGSKVLEGQFLVDYHICQQTDKSVLSDGFMSWPSGHASLSWSGLGYLFLFICSRFAIAVPYLLPVKYGSAAFPPNESSIGEINSPTSDAAESKKQGAADLRTAAAAPPVWLVILALIPIGAASFITATRYTDYYHHAFDLICGTLLGMVCAFIGFRWFHAPLRRGAGWSWAPRSSQKAFGIGIGTQSYALDDVESGAWPHANRHLDAESVDRTKTVRQE